MIADCPARYNLRLVETEQYIKRHGRLFGHAFAICGDSDSAQSGEKLSIGTTIQFTQFQKHTDPNIQLTGFVFCLGSSTDIAAPPLQFGAELFLR